MKNPTWTPRRCIRCGELFEKDPAHAVECPVSRCKAPAGEPCRELTGHAFWGTASHPARVELASTAHGDCPGGMAHE